MPRQPSRQKKVVLDMGVVAPGLMPKLNASMKKWFMFSIEHNTCPICDAKKGESCTGVTKFYKHIHLGRILSREQYLKARKNGA